MHPGAQGIITRGNAGAGGGQHGQWVGQAAADKPDHHGSPGHHGSFQQEKALQAAVARGKNLRYIKGGYHHKAAQQIAAVGAGHIGAVLQNALAVLQAVYGIGFVLGGVSGCAEQPLGINPTGQIPCAPGGGGEVNFPDGLQDTSVHWNQQVQDGTLYVAFNSIQNRNTEYFVAGSDTVQVTGYGTTESTGILEFKVALWELSEDKATTSYVAGTTVYFPTGGECSTYTISGLTPGRLYKANVSYDSGMFYITGGVKIEGIGSDDLVAPDAE